MSQTSRTGTDWRDKYQQLVELHERHEKRHAAAEAVLMRIVSRLCVATSGLDPFLDPHLERLRKAARDGNAAQLELQANAFADAMIKAGDERQRPSVLQRLLERAALPSAQLGAFMKLWSELAGAPERITDSELDRLLGILGVASDRQSADVTEADRKGSERGIFGRLLGRKPADGASPNLVLKELLEVIQWPASIDTQVAALGVGLKQDAAPDTWVMVVRQVSDLVIQALDTAQQEARTAEQFLASLSTRLESLDQHMLVDAQRREASRLSGDELNRAVREEVGGLSDSVRRGGSLQQLQSEVAGSIDRIQGQVESHLAEESKLRTVAEESASMLQQQMLRLEEETFDLRRQVAVTHQQAYRDPLTGLPNRRAYDERLAQEYARWKRFHQPLALIVWDIDNFKQVNDRYGHPAGDKALALVGNILQGGLRETDFIARYGGEEFVVLLCGAEQDDALRVADGMRLSVENAGMHSRKQPVTITVSGGLSMFRKGDPIEAAFERADRALYEAKHQGKNCCVPG